MPPRRVRATAVEALDEGEEVTQLGAFGRVDKYLVSRSRLWHAQGQRGVEVPRVEKEERVHSGGRGAVQRGLHFQDRIDVPSCRETGAPGGQLAARCAA